MKWKSDPVRPQPVYTSSKTSTMSRSVHSRRASYRNSAEHSRTLDALNGSSTTAYTSLLPSPVRCRSRARAKDSRSS